MPPNQAYSVSESDGEKILHVSLSIGESLVLMGSDAPVGFPERSPEGIVKGNNVSISLDFDSVEEARRVYGGLSADGRVRMPFDKVFWGAYFGWVVDKFGIHWIINYDIAK